MSQKSAEEVKRVHFNSQAHVVLIPDRDDYRNAKLNSQLWYSSREMKKIMDNYLYERQFHAYFNRKNANPLHQLQQAI